MDAVDGQDESGMVLTLQAWRERRGWGTCELARRAGVHRNTITRLESPRWEPARHCNRETIWKLARALGVEFSQFENWSLERDDLSRNDLPPEEPIPDVPESEAAPLWAWMRYRNLSVSRLTHETGERKEHEVRARYGQRFEMRWSSGIRWTLVKDLLAGKPIVPTRTEIVRICLRIGVQPTQVAEFRALPPEKRLPVRLDTSMPLTRWHLEQSRIFDVYEVR